MNKRKGISLIVLVITILVMIILAGVVVVSLQKNNPIEKAKEATFKSNVKTYIEELSLTISNNFSNGKNIEITASGEDMQKHIPSMTEKDFPLFVIEGSELFYIGKNKEEMQMAANLGILKPLQSVPVVPNNAQAIIYSNGVEKTVTDLNSSWYNYEKKILPNIKLAQGSYYVWIPRYAYRVIYYATKEDRDNAEKMNKRDLAREKNAIGYSDIRGIVNKDGIQDLNISKKYPLIDIEFLGDGNNSFAYVENDVYKYDVRKTKGVENPRGLVVHPAFSAYRRTGDFSEGNFGETKEINGFWFSKFEIGENGISGPGQKARVNVSVDEANNFASMVNSTDAFISTVPSMTKVGSIIYLTYYYGVDIARNAEPRITGSSNYLVNGSQSCTGNVTGIYDLNGCSWEYVNSYVTGTEGGNVALTSFANFLLKNKNNRLVDVYKASNNGSMIENVKVNSSRYGDAFFEMLYQEGSIIYNKTGHHNSPPAASNPVFACCAAYYNEKDTSFDSINKDDGQAYSGTSFRVCLIEK